jgi:hypothetical protein
MSLHLPKDDLEVVKAFLKDRPYMPHVVASKCLDRLGVKISASSVRANRNRFNIPYESDCRITNAVQHAKDRDMEITYEFLSERLPFICQEYKDYLVESYVRKSRTEFPPMHVRSPELMRLQLTAR